MRKRLILLNPQEYEHEYDKNALNTLNIPSLKEYSLDRLRALEIYEKVRNTGNSVKVTENHFPEIYVLLQEACQNLYLKTIPEIYIGSMGTSGWNVNACTMGSENPIIILSSGAVEYLTDDELLYIIGHEAGHIKSGHHLYHSMVSALNRRLAYEGEYEEDDLKKTFNYWSQMSEFTADRAGLLACQDINVAITVGMKLCGVPPKLYDEMDTKEFMNQAEEFNSYDSDTLLKMYKNLIDENLDHPWGVIRAYELLKWIKSGRFKQILDIHSKNVTEIQNTCFTCGNILRYDEIFCGKCGTKRWEKCPHCGETIIGEESFCGSCGKKLWERR